MPAERPEYKYTPPQEAKQQRWGMIGPEGNQLVSQAASVWTGVGNVAAQTGGDPAEKIDFFETVRPVHYDDFVSSQFPSDDEREKIHGKSGTAAVQEYDKLVDQCNAIIDGLTEDNIDEDSRKIEGIVKEALALLDRSWPPESKGEEGVNIPEPPRLPHGHINRKTGLFEDSITPWMFLITFIKNGNPKSEIWKGGELFEKLKIKHPTYLEYLENVEQKHSQSKGEHADEYNGFAQVVYEYGKKYFPNSILWYDTYTSLYNEEAEKEQLDINKLIGIAQKVQELFPHNET